jgi:hypothetical protein
VKRWSRTTAAAAEGFFRHPGAGVTEMVHQQ